MPDVYEEAQRLRREVLARDRIANRLVLDAWRTLRRDIAAAISQLQQAITARDDTPVSWTQALERLREINRTVEQQIAALSRRLDEPLADAATDSAQAGVDDATRMLAMQTPAAVTVLPPTSSVEQIVAATTRGPLADLLAGIGGQIDRSLVRALVLGVAQGRSPRVIARQMAKLADLPAHRALAIARTEQLRAYREASRATYQANAGIVDHVIWTATLDQRTCAVCWAMHGTVMPADQVMGTHVMCRCTTIPVTKPWSELGIDAPDVPVNVTPGPELFAGLDDAQQLAILGPAKLHLYQRGMPLSAVVGERVHPQWGPTRFERAAQTIAAELQLAA